MLVCVLLDCDRFFYFSIIDVHIGHYEYIVNHLSNSSEWTRVLSGPNYPVSELIAIGTETTNVGKCNSWRFHYLHTFIWTLQSSAKNKTFGWPNISSSLNFSMCIIWKKQLQISIVLTRRNSWTYWRSTYKYSVQIINNGSGDYNNGRRLNLILARKAEQKSGDKLGEQ